MAILLIHHLKKEKENDDWLNEFSGSQGLAGGADTLFSLKRTRTQLNAILHRTGRDVEEKDFSMHLDGFGWVLDGEVEAFTMPEWKRQILDYLEDHESITPIEVSKAYVISINAAKKRLLKLLKEGLLKKTGHGKYELQK